MRFFVFVFTTVLSTVVFSAPDEELLGKAQGYPVCPMKEYGTQRCLVGQLSHFDQIAPARVVKAGAPRELKRAEKEPALGVDALLDLNRNTGLMIIKSDTVLVERYQYDRKPADRMTSMSMAKTVVSMLIGIALAENKIGSIDDVAAQYVPELKGHPYGETKLRHLLTMSSGVKFREEYDGKDDVTVMGRKAVGQQGPGGADTVLSFNQRIRPAGKQFYYASAETQVLGLVLRAAIQRPIADYLSEKIWIPMGAEADASWLIDRGGYEAAYCCMNATLRDWGRLGMLLANYGALDGRQIITADWVRAATHPDSHHLRAGQATAYNGYGYQTWLVNNDGRFALLGVRGQAVFVDPKTKVVIVHTSAFAQSRDPQPRTRQYEFFARVNKTLSQD